MGRLAEALRNYEKAVRLAERQNHRALAVYRRNAARLRNRLAPDDDRRPL